MSYSNHKKVLKQLVNKPAKQIKFKKHNAPGERSCGINLRRCKMCGRTRSHIRKYGLNICRQCFRQFATKLGFKKYN